MAFTDKDCVNDVIPKKKEFESLIEKEAQINDTKVENAYLLNRNLITSSDAFEILNPPPHTQKNDTYQEVFEIIEFPIETSDGKILLKYKAKEFTNDNCVQRKVLELVSKTCEVTVPAAPAGTLSFSFNLVGSLQSASWEHY